MQWVGESAPVPTVPSMSAWGGLPPEEAAAQAPRFADFKVIRRNGSVVAFEPGKISVAMTKAFLAVNGGQGAASARVRELVDSLTGGVIAALAVQQNIAPRAVDPMKVQRLLLEAGDTLTIEPVKARHGTEAWRELQMEVLKKGVEVK